MRVSSDPDTPSNYYDVTTPIPLNSATTHHQLVDHANLYLAIVSLNIGNTSDPHTPVNSPTSSNDNSSIHPTNTPDLNLVPEEAPQGSPNEEVDPNCPFRRTWVDGTGPYITTGELNVQTDASSDTESDSEIVRMFNLDKLNEGRPEWARSNAWDVRQIPEDFDSIMQPVVNRVDRDRLRVESVNSNSGPSIRRVSEAGPSQIMSLDTGLNSFFGSEAYGLGPGPPSPASINSDPGYLSSLHCNDVLPETNGAARKRFGPDLGRLGRNIRQRLLCGFLPKEDLYLFRDTYKHDEDDEVWSRD
nr:hypothetical protein CFP56_54090 [Quercus suber]